MVGGELGWEVLTSSKLFSVVAQSLQVHSCPPTRWGAGAQLTREVPCIDVLQTLVKRRVT